MLILLFVLLLLLLLFVLFVVVNEFIVLNVVVIAYAASINLKFCTKKRYYTNLSLK